MFKSLWKKLGASDEEDRPPSSAYDADELRLLCDHFQIGRPVSYFPEFMREVVFPTIIIAYRVNGQYIYTADDVERDEHGDLSAFRIGPKTRVRLSDLKSFQILLPDTSDLEKKLDYFTRAELGRAGQFRTGNTITLQAQTQDRGIPTVDTTVDRRETLASGPYADTHTVLVTPQLNSLEIADKRRKSRVAALVAADLHQGVDAEPVRCTLCDFSEQSLRLIPRGKTTELPPMAEGAHVEVEFQTSIDDPVFRLSGQVLRADHEHAVISVIHRVSDSGMEKLTPLDVVRIKTGLLNSGG